MKSLFLAFLACALISGCGGGGGNDDSGGTPATVTTTTPSSGSSSTPVTQAVAMSTATVCGVVVPPLLVDGTVTAVHDGDTITLSVISGSYTVRLDGIDAPELAQPFGEASRQELSRTLLGKQVQVAYGQRDRYGRVVGSVFTSSCEFANLRQLTTGMAWFYKAYQCELSGSVRTAFAAAQTQAAAAHIGLWSDPDPEAPWFFRNGTEPATPQCTSAAPSFYVNDAMPDSGEAAPAPATTTTTTAPATTSTTTTTTTTSGTRTGSSTCYVGPRGGTYTITANGNKNYSGC